MTSGLQLDTLQLWLTGAQLVVFPLVALVWRWMRRTDRRLRAIETWLLTASRRRSPRASQQFVVPDTTKPADLHRWPS